MKLLNYSTLYLLSTDHRTLGNQSIQRSPGFVSQGLSLQVVTTHVGRLCGIWELYFRLDSNSTRALSMNLSLSQFLDLRFYKRCLLVCLFVLSITDTDWSSQNKLYCFCWCLCFMESFSVLCRVELICHSSFTIMNINF